MPSFREDSAIANSSGGLEHDTLGVTEVLPTPSSNSVICCACERRVYVLGWSYLQISIDHHNVLENPHPTDPNKDINARSHQGPFRLRGRTSSNGVDGHPPA